MSIDPHRRWHAGWSTATRRRAAFGVGLLLVACVDAKHETQAQTEESLEIFSWWTSGGEAEALQALFTAFAQRAPDVDVVNVAAADPTRARDRLQTRMNSGEPPDSFQVIAGADLQSWVRQGKMTSLTALAKRDGWLEAFPAELVEIISHDGDIYGVPVDIERDNNLYYDVRQFDELGLEPPTSFAQFRSACSELRKQGRAALTLPAAGWVLALVAFETLLPAVTSGAYYRSFFTAEVDLNGPEMAAFLDEFVEVLACSDVTETSESWTEGADRMARSEAAMYVMGDWVKGYWENGLDSGGQPLPYRPTEDFRVVPGLGSVGYFVFNSAVFGLPQRALHPRATSLFLEVAASLKGQEAFNRAKGAVPARVDADLTAFDDIVRGAVTDFQKAASTPDHLLPGYAALTSFDYQKKVNPALLVFAVGGARARALDPNVPAAEKTVPPLDRDYLLDKLVAASALLPSSKSEP